MPLRVLETCSVNKENLNLRLMDASIFTANLTAGLQLRKETVLIITTTNRTELYRVILSVLDPRKCEYLKDYSLDFEHAYMTTYLAS